MSNRSLPMPGGEMPSSEIITPYQGGQVRMSPEAQVASRAASEFTQSFESTFDPSKRKYNRMDRASAQNLEELTVQMRRDRPKPATVINLHPFDLQFNADNYLLRGHVVPACLPGMPYSYKALRGWRHDGGSPNEDGSRRFKAILPIDVAGQFVREFNDEQTFGPGVLIYLGDSHPDKTGDVEIYDVKGRPITTEQDSFDVDEDDNRIPIKVKASVIQKFSDLLADLRQRRNAYYLRRVQTANDLASKDGGKFSSWIRHSDRLMAEVLYHEGIIDAVPGWKLATKLDKGMSEKDCPSCQRPVQKNAYRCDNCSNILDALAAFKDGAIDFEHAKIALLPDDQFTEAKEIHTERMKLLAKRGLMKREPKEGKKA